MSEIRATLIAEYKRALREDPSQAHRLCATAVLAFALATGVLTEVQHRVIERVWHF